jgi:hypothetical protein
VSKAALCVALAAAAYASPDDRPAVGRAPDTAEFVRLARAATERYRDREAAAADGYRLIGEDFPGMGEHWIQTDRVFDGVYEPTQPEVLTYVTIAGTPRLLGIAYALPLLEGEQPPDEPAGRDAWHAHTGSLDDETLAPHHHHSSHAESGARLAMVHAWVWLDNPEGTFAADNWSIPFLRLGLEPPREPAAAAGKALSLLSGGGEYVARVVASSAQGNSPDAAALHSAITAAGREAARVLAERQGDRLPPRGLERLASAWREMWRQIEALLPAEAVSRLASQAMR